MLALQKQTPDFTPRFATYKNTPINRVRSSERRKMGPSCKPTRRTGAFCLRIYSSKNQVSYSGCNLINDYLTNLDRFLTHVPGLQTGDSSI